ncbi:MAG: hypothetical protein KDB80_14775 [Planctomycetes bacterium]|nr:hypothetical protein [Planctomycetota bacterium]
MSPRILLLSVCVLLSSCQLDRMFRIAPLGPTAADPDRVNVWPLFYSNADQVAVLWPLFDSDERGFALRPIITKDGSDWGVLMPLSFWNTERGDWFVFPAYSWGDVYGLAPVFGVFDELTHVGPIWWNHDAERERNEFGLFPVFALQDGLNFVGPAFWNTCEPSMWGLLPVFGDYGTFQHAGPVFWTDGEDPSFGLFPLFAFGGSWGHAGPFVWADLENGGGVFVSPIGGRSWNADGTTRQLNVLGPVFHSSRSDDGHAIAVLWPLFRYHESKTASGWSLWPLHGREARRDAESDQVEQIRSWSLAGLVSHSGVDSLEQLRVLGLFAYRAPGDERTLADWFTLFGSTGGGESDYDLHVGTPAVFQYHREESGSRWSSLLGTVQYEQGDEGSEFRFLYYLYRQKTQDGVTQRDLFPFISWDTGEERSRFSFLWRVFDYERDARGVRGHFLFIPWG